MLFSATTSNPAAYGPAGLQSAVLGRNTSSGQVTITETLTYDKRMRVLSKTDQSSSGTAYSFSIPSTGGYDAVGNLKSVNDTATGNWTYKYDTLNRLLTGSASSGNYAGYKGCWAYDPFANRTAETYQTATCPSNPTPTASYSTLNQVTWTSVNGAVNGFVYDAAGNVINDNANAYVYDFDGRICAVKNLTVGTMTQYVYDAEGHRVAKGTIASWPAPGATCSAPTSANGFSLINDSILDLGGNEVDQTNGINWMHTNIFVGGKLLATYGAATTFFALNDWLGTKRAEITPDGYLSTFFTLPYGNGFAMSGNAPNATAHQFTGKELDAETGLANGNYYFGARYYSSAMGRFMSPDYDGADDDPEPVPYAALENPQTLNLYTYGRNNPLGGVDVDGHDGDGPGLVTAIETGLDAADVFVKSIWAEGVASGWLPAAGEGAAVSISGVATGGVAVIGGAMLFPKDLDPGELTPAQQAAYTAQMMGKGGNQRHDHTHFEQLSDEEIEALLKDPKTRESDKQKLREQQKANRTRNAAKRGGKKQKAPPVKNDPASVRARQQASAAPMIAPTASRNNSSVTTTEQYNLPPKKDQ